MRESFSVVYLQLENKISYHVDTIQIFQSRDGHHLPESLRGTYRPGCQPAQRLPALRGRAHHHRHTVCPSRNDARKPVAQEQHRGRALRGLCREHLPCGDATQLGYRLHAASGL